MDSANERNLRSMAPTLDDEAKIVPMMKFVRMATRYDHVPDPYYEGPRALNSCSTCLRTDAATSTTT